MLVAIISAAQPPKPRVVITADPELDDNNTLIRAMLYSSDFQIEGLVYTSSTFHWKGDGQGTTQYLPGREYTRLGLCPCTSWRWAADEHFIDDIVDAYAKVYANLKVHNPNYPSPAQLKSKIKWGNVTFEGDYSADTDGSNLIKSLLLDNQPGPLYVTAQGGHSTIARALKSIHDQYANTPQWEAIRDKVSLKLVVIPSGDQDGTYARYIHPNWPEVSERQLSTMDFGYFVRNGLSPENQVYVSPVWTRDNVSNRGPLGALYRVWGDGKQMVKGDRTDYFGLSGLTGDQLKNLGYMVWTPPHEKGSFIGEGDTPTFLNFVDNGLRAYENRRWSGWGGSSRSSGVPTLGLGTDKIFPDSPDDPGMAIGLAPAGSAASQNAKTVPAPAGDSRPPSISATNAVANARFFAAAQNDFAARLKWSVTPKFNDANHEPKVRIKGPPEVSARPGSTVRLEGEVSDPDRNTVSLTWWQDRDAGTYSGEIRFSDQSALTTDIRVPSDAQPGNTIQVILEATDTGTPPLTRYQRLIVRIQ
ncbi:MAG TPA: nucleoside hydrolase-like domain-containing protein [Bryobacteraceae bacterium]|nr:nucleoside hydrolase-like domain-containing protein [Bryobacteraceae bacterium]